VDAEATARAPSRPRLIASPASRVSESELTSGEPVHQGSTFRTVNRGQTYDATIKTYDRPNRLRFEVTGRQMDITAACVFSAVDPGTKVESSFDFRPKGFEPLFTAYLHRSASL